MLNLRLHTTCSENTNIFVSCCFLWFRACLPTSEPLCYLLVLELATTRLRANNTNATTIYRSVRSKPGPWRIGFKQSQGNPYESVTPCPPIKKCTIAGSPERSKMVSTVHASKVLQNEKPKNSFSHQHAILITFVQRHKQYEFSRDWPTRLWLRLPLRSSRTRANECAARHFVGPELKICPIERYKDFFRWNCAVKKFMSHPQQFILDALKWPIPTLSKVNWAEFWTAFLPLPSERQRPWHTSKSHLSKVVTFPVALTLASLTQVFLIFFESKNGERKVHLHHMRWWLHCRCTGLASMKSRNSSVLGSQMSFLQCL